jgi:hypothetical protein
MGELLRVAEAYRERRMLAGYLEIQTAQDRLRRETAALWALRMRHQREARRERRAAIGFAAAMVGLAVVWWAIVSWT